MSDVSSAASGAPAASAAKVRGAASPASARPAPASGEKRGSCAPCRRAHQGCDGTRPCRRCIATHQEANCIDQPPGTSQPRPPRAAPPPPVLQARGEGEGPPCPNCQFGSRTNPHCSFGRCRKCCIIARNDCPVHRDEAPGPGGLSLRPRAPAPSPGSSRSTSHSFASSAPSPSPSAPQAPNHAATAAALLVAQQGGVPLSQAHAPPVKDSAQPSGPPPPFRLAPARSLCDQFIYNPEPSMIRPPTAAPATAVLVHCPSCHREVSRLGGALWVHMAHCNPDLYAEYLAGTLVELPAAAAAPAPSAIEVARAAAEERFTQRTALLTELFAAHPPLEALGAAEELAQTLHRDERAAALQRVLARLDRMAELRPGVATRVEAATRRRDAFWHAYEDLPALAPAALAAAAAKAPPPPPVTPPLQVRAQRVHAPPTAKRKREEAQLLQL